MRATTAVLAVVAIATAGFAASVLAQQEPPVDLGSGGIELADAPVPTPPTDPDPVESPDPSTDGGAVPSTPAEPAAPPAEASGDAVAPEADPDPVETVEPAPARTMPPQASLGKPESPGKSDENPSGK